MERGDGGLFVAGAGAPAGVGSGVLRLLSRASRRTAGHATSPVLRRSRAAASAAYRASLCTGELGAVSRYIATSPHTEASLLKNNGQITARNGHFGPMHMILRQSTMPNNLVFFYPTFIISQIFGHALDGACGAVSEVPGLRTFKGDEFR